MKLIEADKVKRVMKDYWKAQVDKALTLTFIDGNEANKRINSYLEHNHDLLKAIDELPSAEPDIIRCKDCKHLRFFDPCFYCYEMGGEIIVPENGFCFKAERRQE